MQDWSKVKNEGNKEIAVIQKNAREVLIVSCGKINGREFIDIRVCFKLVNGAWAPTRKGISFQSDKSEEIIKAIQDATNEIKRLSHLVSVQGHAKK